MLGERIIETEVGKESGGVRLDLFLSRRFTYHSRNQWQGIIEEGKILLNGVKTRASRKLQAGEIVSFVPDKEEPRVDCSYDIVYQDEYYLVVNKSGNLPSHPAGPFFKNTLWYMLSNKLGKISVVNRLDRETSGLILIALNSEAATRGSAMFTKGVISKKYYSLVFGDFKDDIHADGYLVPDSASNVRKKRKFVFNNNENSDCETAETYLSRISGDGQYSLVEAKLKTGRLHQIRTTLFSLGFPLLGDKLYGPDDGIYLKFVNDKMSDNDWQVLKMRRQALHAYHLSFTHPFKEKEIVVEIPPADDILSYIETETDFDFTFQC